MIQFRIWETGGFTSQAQHKLRHRCLSCCFTAGATCLLAYLLTLHDSLLREQGLNSTSPSAALKCLTLYVLSLQTVSRSWISDLLFLALLSCIVSSVTAPHINNTAKHQHCSLLQGSLVQLCITRVKTVFVPS